MEKEIIPFNSTSNGIKLLEEFREFTSSLNPNTQRIGITARQLSEFYFYHFGMNQITMNIIRDNSALNTIVPAGNFEAIIISDLNQENHY